MNRLFGKVADCKTEGEISLVGIDVSGSRITSLVLESSDSAAYLAPGSPVTVLFKESEVALAVGPALRISIRNQLPCEVVSLTGSGILAHVVLAYGGSLLHSLISAQAARDLGLRPGAPVHALIKATEVGLAEGHVPG
jgi:molybdate transport system regulatory protein